MGKPLIDYINTHQATHLVLGYLKLRQTTQLILSVKKRIKVTSMDSAYTNDDGESVSIDIKSAEKDPEEVTIHGEKVEWMREIVKKLKPRYRDLIEKRYFQELSYDEIAKDMDLPLGTVKAQLFRARAFLAEMMKHTKDVI